MRWPWRWVTAGAVVLGGVQLARLMRTIHVGTRLARQRRRFVRRRAGPAPRLLIVGDSSAAGTGASSPGTTVAGRMAQRYPDATSVNLAHVGSRTHDVAEQLQRLSRRIARRREGLRIRGEAQCLGSDVTPSAPYAIIVIHTGGNDALHFTSPSRVAAALARALSACAGLADATVVVTGGNFALAPGLPVPLTFAWSWWERRLRAHLARVCAAHGAAYVDLYREAAADPTSADPARYFAADGVHPNDRNYRVWFREIDRVLRDRGWQVRLTAGAPVQASRFSASYGRPVSVRV